MWLFIPQNPKREQKRADLKVVASWDFNIPVENLPSLCPSASATLVVVLQPPSSVPCGAARDKQHCSISVCFPRQPLTAPSHHLSTAWALLNAGSLFPNSHLLNLPSRASWGNSEKFLKCK